MTEFKSYQTRVIEEAQELFNKIVSLSSFMATPEFERLGITETCLLNKQLDVMEKYHEILVARMSEF